MSRTTCWLQARSYTSVVAALGLAVFAAAVGPAAAGAAEVVTTVVEPCAGSSNPTFYANNHRMVVTPGGRQLALYDPDGSGVQLAWRDGTGAWNQKSIFGFPTRFRAIAPRS